MNENSKRKQFFALGKLRGKFNDNRKNISSTSIKPSHFGFRNGTFRCRRKQAESWANYWMQMRIHFRDKTALLARYFALSRRIFFPVALGEFFALERSCSPTNSIFLCLVIAIFSSHKFNVFIHLFRAIKANLIGGKKVNGKFQQIILSFQQSTTIVNYCSCHNNQWRNDDSWHFCQNIHFIRLERSLFFR